MYLYVFLLCYMYMYIKYKKISYKKHINVLKYLQINKMLIFVNF